MANQYRWEIMSMDVIPEMDGHENVVQCVHWRRVAIAADGREEYVFDASAVAFDPNSQFVDYANLTQVDVASWLECILGQQRIADLDAALDARIAALSSPPVLAQPVPWS